MKTIIFSLIIVGNGVIAVASHSWAESELYENSTSLEPNRSSMILYAQQRRSRTRNREYILNRNISTFMVMQVCNIIHEAYGLEPRETALKLKQEEFLKFKNLERLRRTLLAQSLHYTNLKKYLDSRSIDLESLQDLLSFAEGKSYYPQFKKFDQDVPDRIDKKEDCCRLIRNALQKKIDSDNKEIQSDPEFFDMSGWRSI